MGRLAGQSALSSAIARTKAWKEASRLKARRDRLAWFYTAPAHMLPASRRRIALLWLIAKEDGGVMRVGYKKQPPVTPTMKDLIRRGDIELKRGLQLPSGWFFQYQTILRLTDQGKALLAGSEVSRADRDYILRCLWSGHLP